MKTRMGFVSNSSTSSFIVLACKVSEDVLSPGIKKILMRKKLLLRDEHGTYIGKILWTAYDDVGYEIKNFHEFRDEMADAYGQIFAEASVLGVKAPVEVIYGVVYEGGFSEVEDED
jgi:hypothetical protein